MKCLGAIPFVVWYRPMCLLDEPASVLTPVLSRKTPVRLAAYLASSMMCCFSANSQEIPEATEGPADIISGRIEELQKLQAEHHRKVAAGEIIPGADLRTEWPRIQQQVVGLRNLIVSLNGIGAGHPERPAMQDKLFVALQQVGMHLDGASHPEFTPRTLDAAQVAEMERIGNAIAGMEFGDRASAKPVRVISPDPCFTLIHLPAPIVIETLPGGTVYLAATTGGAFHNGLSLIELKADAKGLAKTTWTSIGDAVADCDITVYAAAAIEPRGIRIKVVSPSLPSLDDVPTPGQLKGEIPRLESKAVTTKGAVFQPID